MARRRMFSAGHEQASLGLFLGVGAEVEAKLVTVINAIVKGLYAESQANLQGGVLKSRTGKLAGSLKTSEWHKPGVRVGGMVRQRRTAFYGRFWEFGHKRHGPVKGPGDIVEAKRAFMRPALDGNRAALRTRLEQVVKQAARDY